MYTCQLKTISYTNQKGFKHLEQYPDHTVHHFTDSVIIYDANTTFM
jgi:hypothetical protein